MTQDERWNMLRRNHESTELGTIGKQLRRIYGVTDLRIYGITEARSADVRIYGDTELRRYGITDIRSYGNMEAWSADLRIYGDTEHVALPRNGGTTDLQIY